MDNKKCLKPPTSNSSIFTYFLVDDSLQLKNNRPWGRSAMLWQAENPGFSPACAPGEGMIGTNPGGLPSGKPTTNYGKSWRLPSGKRLQQTMEISIFKG